MSSRTLIRIPLAAAFAIAGVLVTPAASLAGAAPPAPGSPSPPTPQSPQSPRTSLTLDAAQRIALERSQLLRAQDSSIAASREMAVSAGQLADPVVKFGVDNLPVEGGDRFSLARDGMTMRRIGVMQEVTREDKRRLRSERYEREADRTLAEKGAAAAQIARDTGLAWFELHYANEAAREIAEQLRLSRMEIEAAEGVYRGGRGSAADLVAARSTVAMIEDRAREADGRIRIARNALARWVGEEADAAGSPPDVGRLGLVESALADHLSAHPELQALSQQEAQALVEAKLAEANRRSDWTWEVTLQQRGSSYPNMVSFGVSIPLQWDRANRQDREVAAKLAQADEARARREETYRAHLADLQGMVTDWRTTRERVTRYRDDILALAVERTVALTSAYRAGRSSSLVEVIAAQRAESEVRLQILNLEAQVAKLWSQIRFIVPHAGHPSGAAALAGVQP